jgi:acetyl-CoA carboxylase carboxyltransferase component
MTEKIARLREKEKVVKLGGGEKRIQKQHDKGKLTARERVNLLLDEGSFVETDMFVKHRCTYLGMDEKEIPGEGIVTGYGTVDGRTIFVAAQDFTAVGGSLGEMHAAKLVKVMELAMKTGAPLVVINDSGGARIQEGIDSLRGYGDIFYRNTLASGLIPQISVIMGPCAGGAVYSPAITDFIFMVNHTSKMFITGPQVIKAVTGEDVDQESLGGAMVHNQNSGNAHFIFDGEEETLNQVKRLLSFLPSNNANKPPLSENDGEEWVPDLDITGIVPDEPNKPYDMHNVIRCLIDYGDFMETQPHYATNMITGFARINGRPVGIIANQPKMLAGCLDINGSDKAARFVRFCDAFNIPLITLVDTPGFLPGVAQEHGGIIRHGAKLLFAYSEATVPKITIITRKSYGGAYLAMCSQHVGADQVFAWPTGEIAVMGPQGAVNVIFRRQIGAAENPEEERENRIEEYKKNFANPYKAAERGYVDAVITPDETRMRIISALEFLVTKRTLRHSKKHSNIPL